MPSLEKMAQKARAKPKTAVKPKQITKKAPTPLVDTFKSTEYINSSDSEEEEGDSEVEDEKTKALAVVAPGVNGNGGVESASSSSESESEEKSSSEEESGSEDEMEIDEPSPPPSSILKKPSITTKPRPLEPKKYTSRLPPSFKPLTISESTAASKLLKKSNLEGKQIWYFTAPSSVPITSIQKISLREGDGDTVKHAGNEYGFVEGTVAVGTKIMVPSSTDGGYKTSSKPISKTLHLQLLSRLPGVTTSGPSPHATVPVPKPVRPQPKGMRMRFYPIGVQPDADEDEEETAQFRIPDAIDSDTEMTSSAAPPTSSSLKRKHKSSEEGSSKKEKKKEKKSSSQPILSQTNDFENDELKRVKKRKITEEPERERLGDQLSSLLSPPPPEKRVTTSNGAAEGEVKEKSKKGKKKKDAFEGSSQTVVVGDSQTDSQKSKEERRKRKKEKKEKRLKTIGETENGIGDVEAA